MRLSKKQKGVWVISLLTATGLSLGIYKYIHFLKQYDSGIKEPIEEGLAFEVVQFNSSDGLIFHRPNGTHIEIPANAIVDETGQEVVGQVEFRFREMHAAREIFLSGIPMQMNGARNKHLESMGMVEMRVFDGAEELKLKTGHQISVDLATQNKPNDKYNLWFLDNNESWEKRGAFETVVNERRELALSRLPEPNEPIKPVKDVLFQLASDENMPHLKVWNGVDWTLAPGQNNHSLYRAMRINWDKIEIKLLNKIKKQYRISFSSKKQDRKGNIFSENISVIASPNVKKKDMSRLLAQYEKDLNTFAEIIKNRAIEEERLLQESAMLNSFTSNGFGVFNIDKLEDTRVLAKINANFDFEDELNAKINKVKILMVCENQNTVLTYNAFDWDELPVLDAEVELIASLPDGSFAYVSSEMYESVLDVGNVSPYFENKRYFKTKKVSPEKLKALLFSDQLNA